MAFKIHGFGIGQSPEKEEPSAHNPQPHTVVPRKSLAQIRFSGKGVALTYYNDRFDLKIGDRVYVEGHYEGQVGRVTELSYNFKIKLSDYKKVIAVVDTDVHGTFHMAGSHFVTFDPATLPPARVALWFNPPSREEDEIVTSTDDFAFPLDDLKQMHVTPAIAGRGQEYYLENRVLYLCLQGSTGFAIVEGNNNYVVEFEYHNGEIRRLICDCPCAYTCKHAVAVMLQLKETLDCIQKQYAAEYAKTGCFAAIRKSTLLSYAIDGKEAGSFTL